MRLDRAYEEQRLQQDSGSQPSQKNCFGMAVTIEEKSDVSIQKIKAG